MKNLLILGIAGFGVAIDNHQKGTEHHQDDEPGTDVGTTDKYDAEDATDDDNRWKDDVNDGVEVAFGLRRTLQFILDE
ncbi:MAG: hypothetical protein IJ549_02625 [Prevotella sp.]|nr:hypothetical protein [Prevotella sp.]